jgi:hypothetical protein
MKKMMFVLMLTIAGLIFSSSVSAVQVVYDNSRVFLAPNEVDFVGAANETFDVSDFSGGLNTLSMAPKAGGGGKQIWFPAFSNGIYQLNGGVSNFLYVGNYFVQGSTPPPAGGGVVPNVAIENASPGIFQVKAGYNASGSATGTGWNNTEQVVVVMYQNGDGSVATRFVGDGTFTVDAVSKSYGNIPVAVGKMPEPIITVDKNDPYLPTIGINDPVLFLVGVVYLNSDKKQIGPMALAAEYFTPPTPAPDKGNPAVDKIYINSSNELIVKNVASYIPGGSGTIGAIGDFNGWNFGSREGTITGNNLVVDLESLPLQVGTNRLHIVQGGTDFASTSWIWVTNLPATDQEWFRITDAASAYGAGDQVLSIYYDGTDYYKVPAGTPVLAPGS